MTSLSAPETALQEVAEPPARPERRGLKVPRLALPVAVFLALALAEGLLQPAALSYTGINLLLKLAVPVMLATLAQLLVMTLGDLDLSIGPLVSLVAGISAVILPHSPLLAVLLFLALILAQGTIGALITWRRLPAIVVTLGLSFVWYGLAVVLLPTPGGRAPEWLVTAMRWRPPLMPLALWVALALALLAELLLMRSALGVILRGAGGNPRATAQAGWSLLRIRAGLYATAALLAVLAGLTLAGLMTAADARLADRYTLLSIAAVILGGGDFLGGRIAPAGAILGAMSLLLATALLIPLKIPPDWQIGAQGLILILVLSLRAGLDLLQKRRAA